MPAIERAPSGVLVEVLCGQPAQKKGERRASAPCPTAHIACATSPSAARRAPSSSPSPGITAISAGTMSEAASSRTAPKNGSPVGVVLPQIAGR